MFCVGWIQGCKDIFQHRKTGGRGRPPIQQGIEFQHAKSLQLWGKLSFLSQALLSGTSPPMHLCTGAQKRKRNRKRKKKKQPGFGHDLLSLESIVFFAHTPTHIHIHTHHIPTSCSSAFASNFPSFKSQCVSALQLQHTSLSHRLPIFRFCFLCEAYLGVGCTWSSGQKFGRGIRTWGSRSCLCSLCGAG